jgi:hypothetical protein
MKRHLEPVDLIVAVGLFATILCGYFVFMVANGTLAAGVPQTVAFEGSASMGRMSAMEWVQPVLGQAIVENYLAEREASLETAQAVTELNRAFTKEQSLQAAPNAHLERIAVHADQIDQEHAARMQYVTGRSIVTSTARGVRAGALSPSQIGGSFNRRIIEMAEASMKGMEDSYRQTREPILGWAIVSAGQQHLTFAEQLQRRLGTAITRVVRVQDRYEQTLGEAQGQLASVALASVHTAQVSDRFTQLAKADFRQPAPAFSEPRSWPDIPIGLFIAFSTCLVGLFFVGLLTPGMRPEEAAAPEAKPKAASYRKTA